MDASQACWYFSTMRHVAFHRTKYGRELLLDAAYVRQMPDFIRADGAEHSLDFHDILLVTKGAGYFLLDGEPNQVSPGVVLFTLPGQVREWRLEQALDGACLFFSRDLTADFFSDPRFLDGFAFFSPHKPSAVLVLEPSMRRQLLARFASMKREIAGLRNDTADAIRAQLYEILVLLNRWYVGQHGLVATPQRGDVVERYIAQIQRSFPRQHRVADYAASLRISPGHLNDALQRPHRDADCRPTWVQRSGVLHALFPARGGSYTFALPNAQDDVVSEKQVSAVNGRDQSSRKLLSCSLRLGCRSFRNALASICRMRSRVTSNCLPTSSSVWSVFMSMPKRILSTFASRGVRPASTECVVSRSDSVVAESIGDSTEVSSMKSPRCESSSSPIGVSIEIGSFAILSTLRTLSSGISMRTASSSGVGSRPISCSICREIRLSLLMVSIMCTGIRMVRAWSAIERVMACRIHQVA